MRIRKTVYNEMRKTKKKLIGFNCLLILYFRGEIAALNFLKSEYKKRNFNIIKYVSFHRINTFNGEYVILYLLNKGYISILKYLLLGM